MKWRILACVFLLGILLAIPFVLRPKLSGDISKATECDNLVIISAHSKNVLDEYEVAFRKYYFERTGRDINMDFRSPGGTSDIMRYINDRFEASFRHYWQKQEPNIPWSPEIADAFNNSALDVANHQASAIAIKARKTFLASNVGIDIDIFAGGGTFDASRNATRGYAVPGLVEKRHPEYFTPNSIPDSFGGDKLYDPQGKYYGIVLSTFGICVNRDRLDENKLAMPQRWEDLGKPEFFKSLIVADPSKSGSSNKCFEIMLQQQMSECNSPDLGWEKGLSLVKRIFANSRTVTDSAAKVIRDISCGEAVAGIGIDTYAFSEIDWIKQYDQTLPCRFVYITPIGGTAVSSDPAQILRGAPNRKQAEMFMDFLLSIEGQKLHCFKVGAPGGPQTHAINRPAIRKELYVPELKKYLFVPDYVPYQSGADFVYHAEWTGKYYTLLSVLLRSIALDTLPELQDAWQAIIAAGGPEKVPMAMKKFNELPFSYAEADEAKKNIKNPIQAAKTTARWSNHARASYIEAKKLAEMGK